MSSYVYAYILNFFPYLVFGKKLFHSPSNTASVSGGHFFFGPTCHLCRLLRLLTGIFLHSPTTLTIRQHSSYCTTPILPSATTTHLFLCLILCPCHCQSNLRQTISTLGRWCACPSGYIFLILSIVRHN